MLKMNASEKWLLATIIFMLLLFYYVLASIVFRNTKNKRREVNINSVVKYFIFLAAISNLSLIIKSTIAKLPWDLIALYALIINNAIFILGVMAYLSTKIFSKHL